MNAFNYKNVIDKKYQILHSPLKKSFLLPALNTSSAKITNENNDVKYINSMDDEITKRNKSASRQDALIRGTLSTINLLDNFILNSNNNNSINICKSSHISLKNKKDITPRLNNNYHFKGGKSDENSGVFIRLGRKISRSSSKYQSLEINDKNSLEKIKSNYNKNFLSINTSLNNNMRYDQNTKDLNSIVKIENNNNGNKVSHHQTKAVKKKSEKSNKPPTQEGNRNVKVINMKNNPSNLLTNSSNNTKFILKLLNKKNILRTFSNDENNTKENKIKCFIDYSAADYPNVEHCKSMEDFYCINEHLENKFNSSFFGIFDGHGGKEISYYLSENLQNYLIKELKNISLSTNFKKNNDYFLQAIINSFEKIDKAIIENSYFEDNVGSTATIVFIYNDESSLTKRTLICANVGDSKAYLINKNNIKLITKEHKCNDINEVARIRKNGGVVFQKRVFGTLILTRSIGDIQMKKYGVIPTPNLFSQPIYDNDLYVVLASDGLWDVVEYEDILKISKEKISCFEFAKKLIKLAKDRDTRDNVSCIVIKLN